MMRIGELAGFTGESVKTLRYWEGLDLLDAERSESGYRHFPEGMIERVGFIRSAQALGFTLEEIREILELRGEGAQPCEEVRTALARHLTSVRERIENLRMLEAELTQRLHWAGEHADPDCPKNCVYVTATLASA